MAEAPKPTSSAEPIDSICVKKFYAPNNQLVEVDQPYVYQPDTSEDPLPYPWPLLRPVDNKRAEALEKEYRTWREKKLKEIDTRNDTSVLLKRLAAGA